MGNYILVSKSNSPEGPGAEQTAFEPSQEGFRHEQDNHTITAVM